MESYISGYNLYEAHRGELVRLMGEPVPYWGELSASERSDWEREADELNEARIGPPEGLDDTWQ
jgi:hypothetical protein